MNRINWIYKCAFMAAALIFVVSATNALAQTVRIDTMEERFDDFEVKAEMWGNKLEEDHQYDNCRIKLHVKNISDGNIMKWVVEGKFRKDLTSSSYDSKSFNRGYIGKGAIQEFVIPDYCGMSRDYLKVYAK